LALAKRIYRKLQPGLPWPLTVLRRRLLAEVTQELQAGMSLGGLHIEDVTEIVESLFYQGARRFTLEIAFENPDDDHLTLTIQALQS